MTRWNGGIIGLTDSPTVSVASGIWGLSEVRKNTKDGKWPLAGAIPVDYVAIAGGGGGGYHPSNYAGGGGGGAGGALAGQVYLAPSTAFSVVIGAGGSGSSSPTSGNNSTFASFTLIGGGKGAGATGSTMYVAASGGSGGGGEGVLQDRRGRSHRSTDQDHRRIYPAVSLPVGRLDASPLEN